MLGLLDTWRPRLLLTAFCLLLWLPGFFTLPPGDRDESRFTQATKQMLETGDFVQIRNGDEARNRKPIGIHWLQAPFVAAAAAVGLTTPTTIWPYRLPSFFGGLIAVLGTFWLGEFLAGRRVATVAAGFLAGSVLLTTEVHIAKTDAALLGSVVLTMAVLARAYVAPQAVGRGLAALFWLALAASVLLKGPVGPMVAGLTALTLVLVDRRSRWLLALRPVWGVPLLVASVLPWFVAIGVATHGQFFSDAVGGDLGRKLSSGDDAHGAPPGLHLLLLPVTLFPAFVCVPDGLVRAWRGRTDAANRFLLAWVVPSWAVFEIVPTKLPHYVLPLLPALCLVAARWLLAPERHRMRPWAIALGGLAGVALAAALGGLPFALEFGGRALLGVPAAIAALGLAALLFALMRAKGNADERRRMLVAAAAIPALYWSALGLELPNLRALWIAPQVAAAIPPGPFAAVGFAEPSLMFLAGTRTQWLSADQGAAELASGEVRSLLVDDRQVAHVVGVVRSMGLQAVRLARFDVYNYSRGRFVTLTLLRSEKSHASHEKAG